MNENLGYWIDSQLLALERIKRTAVEPLSVGLAKEATYEVILNNIAKIADGAINELKRMDGSEVLEMIQEALRMYGNRYKGRFYDTAVGSLVKPSVLRIKFHHGQEFLISAREEKS